MLLTSCTYIVFSVLDDDQHGTLETLHLTVQRIQRKPILGRAKH